MTGDFRWISFYCTCDGGCPDCAPSPDLGDSMIAHAIKHMTLINYSTKVIENNWKVLINNEYVGDLHDCNGSIGGFIGDWTETEVFDHACNLAKKDLEFQVEAMLLNLEQKR